MIWALLAAALLIPALLGLVGGEIGVRRTAFRGGAGQSSRLPE